MSKFNRLTKIALLTLLPALMTAALAPAITAALGLSAGWHLACLTALATALLCVLASLSGLMSVAAAIVAVVSAFALAAANHTTLTALWAWIRHTFMGGIEPMAETTALAGGAVTVIFSVLLTLLLFGLMSEEKGMPPALTIFTIGILACYGMCDTLSIAPAIPGIVAALIALAMAAGMPKDLRAFRALIPAVLAVCLALALVPRDRVTWEPLEHAAQTVRKAFEDYFRFTQERISFTISTEGYNHAEEVDGEVVTRLGGPAEPNTAPVMRVSSEADLLLRGSIHRIYTGSTWTDTGAKARYLFYDALRSRIRESVFGMDNNEGFTPVNASVEMLDKGTSALFVSSRLDRFDMPLDTAVHYNSIGEMFLSRPAQAGDSYSFVGYQPGGQALEAAVRAAASRKDDNYAEILASCTQLPDGIEQGVYALASSLTQNVSDPLGKARAIESWLRSNCTYTLKPGYPDPKRDFVSQFVLDSREGYCSYFASAMTVMCRIAGLPARYVEGYAIEAGQNQIVTGENAHAWTEVYFSGLGWVAFDPSNGADGGSDGLGQNHDGENAPQDMPEHADPTVTPEPTAEPTLPPPDGDAQPPLGEPTPSPAPTDEPFAGVPENTTAPPQEPDTNDGGESRRNGGAWLWILLIALLLLLLIVSAWLWFRARLEKTDPVRMAAKAKTAQEASLIFYRAILTLLAVTGQSPMNGETPGAFARRSGSEAFAAFADALAMSVYARDGATAQTVGLGKRAYSELLSSTKRSDKLRYDFRRFAKGIGSIDSIP